MVQAAKNANASEANFRRRKVHVHSRMPRISLKFYYFSNTFEGIEAFAEAVIRGIPIQHEVCETRVLRWPLLTGADEYSDAQEDDRTHGVHGMGFR